MTLKTLMGVQGLTTLIKRYASDSMNVVSFDSCRGSTISVDTSILLYKFRYADSSGDSHIYGFMKRCLSYIRHGILPIFVIDGKPPPMKEMTILKRKNRKERVNDRIKKLEDTLENCSSDHLEILEQIRKLKKQVINVNRKHHLETCELLRHIGFNVIMGHSEAEYTCAHLQRHGICEYTYSEDTDLFPLGCNMVLREEKPKKGEYTLVQLDILLSRLCLTYEQFVDLCVLCGCDYCPGISRLGSTKIYELILRFGSLGGVLDHLCGEGLTIDRATYVAAKELYITRDPYKRYQIHQGIRFDETALKRFLDQKKIKKQFVTKFIREFKKYMKSMEQCHALAKIPRNVLSLSSVSLGKSRGDTN